MKQNIIQLAAAAVAGAGVTLAVQMALAPRITSSESHAVWNYINEQKIVTEMEQRFNAVSDKWPPTKAEMGRVLLEAHMTALVKKNPMAN